MRPAIEARDTTLEDPPHNRELAKREDLDESQPKHAHKRGHSRHSSFHQSKSSREASSRAKDHQTHDLRGALAARSNVLQVPVRTTLLVSAQLPS